MKTAERRICPGCGNEFSGAVKFCPVCMLRGVLDEKAECVSEQGSGGSTLKMGVERFAQYEVVKEKTGDQSSWVAARWGSLTKRSTSICGAW